MIDRITPQIWWQIFFSGALVAVIGLSILLFYQKGKTLLSLRWAALRMKLLYWYTERRRHRGRSERR